MRILIVILGLSLVGCNRTTQAKPLPIIFDDWWNVDYVKNGCESAAKMAETHFGNAEPCPLGTTPRDTVLQFENELEVAFASQSDCHGLSLIHFTPEMAAAAVKNPNAPVTGVEAKMASPRWQLMLDLDGHSKTQEGQGWSIADPSNHVLSGTITTPQNVMQRVCRIVRGVGGKSEN